jgi:type IV pilus assembly protein PilM
MTSDIEVSFDPYYDWLKVQEPQRPLNAYQLLGLKPLESDFNRIRMAAARQRSYLDARQDDADPEMWQRISDELNSAIDTLMDGGRKQLLDATLKRQLGNQAGSNGSATHAGSSPIKCRNCQQENAPQRRFCGDCGASLFDRCPKCAAEVVASERFCGHCGTNLQETSRQQETELKQRLQQARTMQESHRFDEAAALARSVAVVEDARFDHFAREALAMLDEFASQRRQLASEVEQRVEQARQCVAACAFERGLERLESLPESLHTSTVKELLATLRAKRAELLQLSGEIREGIAQNRKQDLLPKIERLLMLRPDHAQARELAGQLRDQVIIAARKKVATYAYDEARHMLESLPQFVHNDDVEQLLDKVLEVDALATDVRLSPLADDNLVALAQRLVKIAPKDEAAAKQLAEIQARRAVRPANSHVPYAAWSNPPHRALLGLPADRLGHFMRCDYASPELQTRLRQQPGQWFVALGLALQAKEQAAVPLNLLPAEPSSSLLFSKVSFSLRKPQPRGGWGLDLGRTGLRAIRLGPELKDGRVRIEAVVHIPHNRSLGAPGEEVFDVDVIAATLKSFREQHPIAKEKEKRDPVFVSLPGSRTLGRFFDLPPSPAKKIAELVQYEAKHQVPFSLDELSWGYHVLDEAASKPDDSPRHVLLAAAKEFHVSERLAAMKNAELPVDGIVPEPLALHNATVYDLLSGESAPRNMAVMDLGTQGASFVVSSPKRVWFRTSSCGGDDCTAALVKQLQLTAASAEEIKRAPHKARRFHQWHAALQPLFVRQASEIERSLSSFARQFPDRHVEQLLLAGGGAAMHGLLRHLVRGS